FADRQRRRRPNYARILIANVDDFARRITNGVVGPGRQPIFVTVDRPRESAARFGNQESKVLGIRNHVRPGRRRPLTFAECRDVFTTAVRKAPDSVKERKLWRRQTKVR